MKKVLTIIFFATQIVVAQAQIRDTVSMTASYAQQVWYNLQSDTEWKSPRTNWDLAFSVEARNATVQANPLVKVYRPRLSVANVTAAVDTLTLSDADLLYNSDTTWFFGALNQTRITTNPFDEGWGLYNLVSHNVIGDSVFVLKMPTGVWKKFWIERLSVDTTYTIKYSNLDNSNTQTKILRKADFTNQKFAYFNFTTENFIQREPNRTAWDVTFTQYFSQIPAPTGGLAYYILTGVMGNSTTKLAKVAGDSSTTNARAATFKTAINTVGADWKTFDMTNNRWNLAPNTYFIQTRDSNIFRLVFTGFGGAANGNFIFNRQKLGRVAVINIENNKKATLAIAPNPATDGNVTLVYDLGATDLTSAVCTVSDLSGRTVFQANLPSVQNGLTQWTLPQSGLTMGLYFVSIRTNQFVLTEKLMIR